jgi:phosphoserine aminotransferase
VTGEFSNKWYLSHRLVPFIETELNSVDFGLGVDAFDTKSADMVCMTLNETSTGVQTPILPEVSKETLLAIDATSGAGQIKVDFNKVDLYFFSPQKVFASEGGFYIAIMSPKAIKRAEELCERKTYRPEVMSWKNAIDNSLKNQTYNTPSITSIYLLNEQVKLMNGLGEDKVIDMAKEKANYIYTWADSHKHLSCFVEEKKYRSVAVATINIEERFSANDLCQKLRELDIVVDIEAYRKLGLNQLRISLFHNVSFEDIVKLTKIIDFAINQEESH